MYTTAAVLWWFLNVSLVCRCLYRVNPPTHYSHTKKTKSNSFFHQHQQPPSPSSKPTTHHLYPYPHITNLTI